MECAIRSRFRPFARFWFWAYPLRRSTCLLEYSEVCRDSSPRAVVSSGEERGLLFTYRVQMPRMASKRWSQTENFYEFMKRAQRPVVSLPRSFDEMVIRCRTNEVSGEWVE